MRKYGSPSAKIATVLPAASTATRPPAASAHAANRACASRSAGVYARRVIPPPGSAPIVANSPSRRSTRATVGSHDPSLSVAPITGPSPLDVTLAQELGFGEERTERVARLAQAARRPVLPIEQAQHGEHGRPLARQRLRAGKRAGTREHDVLEEHDVDAREGLATEAWSLSGIVEAQQERDARLLRQRAPEDGAGDALD